MLKLIKKIIQPRQQSLAEAEPPAPRTVVSEELEKLRRFCVPPAIKELCRAPGEGLPTAADLLRLREKLDLQSTMFIETLRIELNELASGTERLEERLSKIDVGIEVRSVLGALHQNERE